MDFLQSLLPCPSLLKLHRYEMDLENNHLVLSVASIQTAVPCPVCGELTQRIHSQYQRTLADLPCL